MAKTTKIRVPELDLDGSRIADRAADTLVEVADWLQSYPVSDAESEREPPPDPELLRAVAEALRADPGADPVRVLERRFVDVLVPRDSAQRFSMSGIAVDLLDAALAYIKDRNGPNVWAMLNDVGRWRTAGRHLRMSPRGHLDAEFGRLYAYLDTASAVSAGGKPEIPPTADSDAMYDDNAEFRATVLRAYDLVHGGDFATYPLQAQQVWASKLSGLWVSEHGRGRLALKEAQLDELRFAIETPRQPWVLGPLLPGPWQDLALDDAVAVLQRIGELERVGDKDTPLPLAYHCDRVRTRPLACFGGALLIEMQGYASVGLEPGLICAVMTGDGVAIANGESSVLHDLCDRYGAALDSEAARLDYLQLFANWVRGDDGRFQLIERSEQLMNRRRDPDWSPTDMAFQFRPIRPAGRDSEGRWLFDSLVAYGDALFEARFALGDTGLIEMIDDEPVEGGLPLWPERQEGPLLLRALPPPTFNPYSSSNKRN